MTRIICKGCGGVYALFVQGSLDLENGYCKWCYEHSDMELDAALEELDANEKELFQLRMVVRAFGRIPV